MPVLTTSDGPIDFRYDTAAPAAANSRGSIGLRIDAGNVGTFQNIDGTAAGWRQFLIGGGTISFGADATWTLNDNSATSLVIGATGDADMLTFDTTNAAEVVVIGATNGLRLNDGSELRFGTPGTDLVLTPDGTDVVVTSTGILIFNNDVQLGFGTATNDRFLLEYDVGLNRLQIVGTDISAVGATQATRPMRIDTGDRTLTDAGGSPASGAMTLATGQSLVTFAGGGATGGPSGAILIQSGGTDVTAGANTAGATGAVTIETGSAAATAGTSGLSGVLTLRTGTSVSSTSGDVAVSTGNVTAGAGNSGSITLTTGTSAGGTRGTVQSIGRLTTTDGVAAGTARVVGGQANENPAASAAVANVLTVFSTGSYNIPANSLRVNSVIRFEALIGITAISGGGTTVQIEVFLNGTGGTLVFDTTALNAAAGVAANSYFILTGRLACRSVGAPGTLVGVMQYQLGAVNAAPGTNSSDVAGSVAGTYTVAVTNANANTLDVAAVTDAVGTTVVLQDYHVYMEA